MAKIKVPSEMNLQCKNPLEMGKELPKIWASNGGVGITPKLICSPANTIIQLTDENHTMIGAMQRYKQIETSDDLNSTGDTLIGGSSGVLLFPYIKSNGTIISDCSIGPMVFGKNTYFGNQWRLNINSFTLTNGENINPYCFVDELLRNDTTGVSEFYSSMEPEVRKIVEKQKIPLEKTLSRHGEADTYKLAIICVDGPVENLRLFCLVYLYKDIWYYHGVFNNMYIITSAYQYLFLHNETSQDFLILM